MANNYNPFFILGNPRSGTTLLRLMLDAHSKITVPPECGFLIWFYDKYSHHSFSNREEISLFVSDLKTAKKIESWNLNFYKLEQYLLNNLPLDYAGLVNSIYLFYSQGKTSGKQIWGDKNNFYINHINDLSILFTEAKFIHIVRDGRDVACSYKELNEKKIESEYAPKLPVSIEDIGQEWHTNNKLILKDIDAQTKKSNYLLIRYEDLIYDTNKELQRVSLFLNLAFEKDMLLYYKNSKSHEPNEYLQWKAKTKKPPTADSIGRYKRDLTMKEQKEFINIARSTLEQFNYEI